MSLSSEAASRSNHGSGSRFPLQYSAAMGTLPLVVRVSPSDQGQRLDIFLLRRDPGVTRSHLARLIKDGRVTVNDRAVKPGYRVKASDIILLNPPEPALSDIRPEHIPVTVVYEDHAVVVVDKPQGVVVHPAPGHRGGTLVNALLPGIGGGSLLRPGVVHRLDKGTSGLLVFSRSDNAYYELFRQFKEHSVRRIYSALVFGSPAADSGTCETLLGRHPVHRKKIAVLKDRGRHAVTRYTVRERFPGMTLLDVRPETGRTHQIRVHLSSMGLPIVGDDLYGGKRREKTVEDPELLAQIGALDGPALHAGLLGFIHPDTGKYMEFTSRLPVVFEAILRRLRAMT